MRKLSVSSLAGVLCFSIVVNSVLFAEICGAQTYDISAEAHFPDVTAPFNTEDNPPVGNVWTYGFRDTGAGGVNKILWNDNGFDVFKAFDRFEQLGADVIGGGGSFGDINTMCEEHFISCAAGGNLGAQVKIVDYGSGPLAHVVAEADSFLKGTVHLFTDDDAPTDRAAIIRFTPPVPGDYTVDVLFENRANTGFQSDKATYHAVVTRGGGPFETFEVISEGFLGPKTFNSNLGLGSGAFVEVQRTVTLGANDFIELAAMGSGAFPGVPIAVVGTIQRAVSGAPGDFDGDQDSDGTDFLIWQRGFGSTYDGGDYDDWKSRFGTSGGSIASTSGTVPEPATSALLLLATGVLGWRRAIRCARRAW